MPETNKPQQQLEAEQQEQQEDLPAQVHQLELNDSIENMITILLNPETSREQLIFNSQRLVRHVVEHALNLLPSKDCDVTTPTGEIYSGVEFGKGICGVNIMRAGEVMEHGLRACCLSIRMGHILLQHKKGEEIGSEPQLIYMRLPPDISERHVLLMDPIIASGATIIKAVRTLQEQNVKEENITLLNLFASPSGLKSFIGLFPKINIVSAQISETCCGIDFSDRYFGT